LVLNMAFLPGCNVASNVSTVAVESLRLFR
jgi:hypothetical protein